MKVLLLAPFLLFACGTPSAPPAADTHVADNLRIVARRDSIRKDSLSDGHHIFPGPNGRTRLEGEMRNGKRNGIWTSYTLNGRTKSRNQYVDGVLQGPTVTFHDNGAIYYKGQYLNDKSFGEWAFFDDKGGLIRTVTYDSTGVQVGQ